MDVVQANGGPKYEKTTDVRRMLTHKALNEAIRTDWGNVRRFLPARTSTVLSYESGTTKAKAWNEGESEVSIDLPLKDGWYIPDGNPFAIPNGQESNDDDPNALYLWRYQDRSYTGPVGRVDCLRPLVRCFRGGTSWSRSDRAAGRDLRSKAGWGYYKPKNTYAEGRTARNSCKRIDRTLGCLN